MDGHHSMISLYVNATQWIKMANRAIKPAIVEIPRVIPIVKSMYSP